LLPAKKETLNNAQERVGSA